MNELAARGIATRRIMAIHLEPFYRKLFPDISLPVAEDASANSMLLPIFVGLTNSEQDEVVGALLEALD
jgi:perosamine synthetase